MGYLGDFGQAVRVTGDQTIKGQKTFQSSPIVPAGTASGHAVNKTQLDVVSQAIENAASASAMIINQSTPAFSNLPTVATALPYTIQTDSSNANIISLNDGSDTVTFKKAGNYSFNSTLTFKATTAWSSTVTFDLIDSATSNVVLTQSLTLSIPANGTQYVPLNTLISVTSANEAAGGLSLVFKAHANVSGLTMESFNSQISSAAGGAAGVDLVSDQTVGGVKTFNASPIVPNATLATQAVNLSQLEAVASSVVGATVVGLPTVTGSTTQPTGYSATYTATAKPLLDSNVTIASFTFVFDGGTPVTVPATNTGTGDAISGTATTSYTWTGTAGSAKTFTVFATDSMGNKSSVKTVNITLTANNVPTAPTITASASVVGGSTGNQVSFSGSTDADGDAITYSITGTGGITFSKTSGIASGEIVTYTAPTVSSNTQYTFQAVAVDSLGGQSSATSKTVTVTALPAVGGAYGGGYYVGKMVENGITYALIVAPKASGQHNSKQWKTTNDNTLATASYFDGLANSNAMNNASHPAAQFCRALTIGGYNDWYLPARDELELCYRNLKPETTANKTGSRSESGNYGDNANSLPVGASYTTASPAQTTLTAFKSGGSECFNVAPYWSSTQYTPNVSLTWKQDFDNGIQNSDVKSNNYYVRAVRKIAL